MLNPVVLRRIPELLYSLQKVKLEHIVWNQYDQFCVYFKLYSENNGKLLALQVSFILIFQFWPFEMPQWSPHCTLQLLPRCPFASDGQESSVTFHGVMCNVPQFLRRNQWKMKNCLLPENCQGSHSDWKTWKTWKNGKAFSSQGILNRLEKLGKSQGKSHWKTQGIWDKYYLIFLYIILVIFKWTVYCLLKWIKFSVKKTKH